MKKNFFKILQFIFFLALGVFLFYKVYQNVDIDELWIALKSVNYFWVILSFVMALFSHLFRTLRWQMLIEPLGKKPRFINTYLSVLVLYLANFALPRMGEVSRCGLIKKYEGIPFTKLLGTVLVERSVDFIMLVLIFLFVFFTQFNVLQRFIENNPEINGSFANTLSSSIFYLYLGGAVLAVILFYQIIRIRFPNSWLFRKIKKFIKDISEGIRTIMNMKRKWLFIFYTLMVYITYFFMTWVVFFGFDFSSDLSPNVALTLLVMGSIGIIVVQGGIGAYHFLVVETLFIYGIDKLDGQVFALVMHGLNTLGQVIFGFLALIIFPIYNKKLKQNQALK